MVIYNGTYCVYAHINKINGKIYIGQTVYGDNPIKRWGSNGCHYKTQAYFYNAIQKYGWDNFEHEVIANHLTAEEADKFEKLLIEKLNTTNHNFGYNLESGGKHSVMTDEIKQKISRANKGKVMSEETKIKISKSSKERWNDEEFRLHMSEVRGGENNPMYGISPKERMDKDTYESWLEQTISRVKSEEFKQRMREINLGKKYSAETNAKKGLKGEKHPCFGKHLLDETKEKLRKANVGRKYSEETNKKKGRSGAKNPAARAVNQYDTDGHFIKQWDYISLAAKEFQICPTNICNVCSGRHKTAGGYVWKYADEDREEA